MTRRSYDWGAVAEHRPGRRTDVRTGHSIMWGFDLEAVDGLDNRKKLLRNAMQYFGALE